MTDMMDKKLPEIYIHLQLSVSEYKISKLSVCCGKCLHVSECLT